MAKILIVEDEPIVAQDIQLAIEKTGHEVVARVIDEESCLNAVKKYQPDIVFMDINLNTDVDGIEIVELLRYEKSTIKVVYLTAYSDTKTIDRACKTDPSSYIMKPFKRKDIEVALKITTLQTTKSSPNAIDFGNGYSYKESSKSLYIGDIQIPLTVTESKLFTLCLEHKNTIIPYTIIEEYVWPDREVSASTKRGLYFRLRTKLNGHFFETISHIGCRLNL